MRVLYVLSSTTPYGGASKSVLSLVRSMHAAGVQVHVVVPDDGGLCAQLREWGVGYSVLNYRMGVYPPTSTLKDKLLFAARMIGRLCVNDRAARKLCAVASEFKPDLIHTNTSVISIGYLAARRLHLPHVWHIREYGDKDFGFHYMFTHRRQINRYKGEQSYTICITKGVQEYNGLTDTPSSRVIYNGVIDEKDVLTLDDSGQRAYLLFAGRLEPNKGIEALIDAYEQYARNCSKPLPLRVAGGTDEPAYEQMLRKKVEVYGLGASVQFMGACQEMKALYRGAKAVVVCSPSEGFGRVAPEAMSMGCVVIGYNAAGTREQFDNGKELTGDEIALRYNTPDQLVRHMVDITDQPWSDYADLRRRAQHAVGELYSVDRYAEQVMNMYKDIIAR